MKKISLQVPLKVFSILIGLFLLLYAGTMVFVAKNAFMDTAKKSDAIVVLGADPGKKNQINPCLAARVDHAIDLYKNGYGKKIIFSGGTLPGYRASEASVMDILAKEHGLNESEYFLESRSTSTFENLTFSSKIMEENNLGSIVIITDPYHEPRAGLIAQKIGIDYSLSPASMSPCSHDPLFVAYFLLREPLATMYYKVTGKL